MLSVSGGQSIPCLVADGLTQSSDGRRSETSATVTALNADIGRKPQANDRIELAYGGESYSLAVTEDDISETHGAIYTFTIAG